MIKVGQFMSSRLDVLPPEITKELEGLQDEVPAETLADVQAVIAAEFKRPVGEVFAWFKPEPEAAASLATELLEGGAPGVHLYALNRAEAPLGVGARLGWRVRQRLDVS